LLFATGMRVGEVSGLNIQDFGVSESVFRVNGKGGRDRLAFLVDEQSRRIQQEHLELRNRIASEFLSKVVYATVSGGDLMSVHLGSVFESEPLNYLDQELTSFQLVPLLFCHFR